MRANGCSQYTKTTKRHTWEGFYHPYSGEYEERQYSEVDIEDLQEDERSVANLDHDITIFIVPECYIIVFARAACNLARYKELMGADHIKKLLDDRADEDTIDNYYFWKTYDFPASI